MSSHKIYCRHRRVEPSKRLSAPIIKHCVRTALSMEGVDMPCEVSVLITDDKGIRVFNRNYRGIDKATDVLSFPMLFFTQSGWANRVAEPIDLETGLVPLGEIVFSAERLDKQAYDFGHSREQETAYLTVHSVLHLLGYDHVDEAEDKRDMREREKVIMKKIGNI